MLDYVTGKTKQNKKISLGNFQNSGAQPKYSDLEYIILEQSRGTELQIDVTTPEWAWGTQRAHAQGSDSCASKNNTEHFI